MSLTVTESVCASVDWPVYVSTFKPYLVVVNISNGKRFAHHIPLTLKLQAVYKRYRSHLDKTLIFLKTTKLLKKSENNFPSRHLLDVSGSGGTSRPIRSQLSSTWWTPSRPDRKHTKKSDLQGNYCTFCNYFDEGCRSMHIVCV